MHRVPSLAAAVAAAAAPDAINQRFAQTATDAPTHSDARKHISDRVRLRARARARAHKRQMRRAVLIDGIFLAGCRLEQKNAAICESSRVLAPPPPHHPLPMRHRTTTGVQITISVAVRSIAVDAIVVYHQYGFDVVHGRDTQSRDLGIELQFV